MCNWSEYRLRQGEEIGLKIGEEKGIKIGEEKGLKTGVEETVKVIAMFHKGSSAEDIAKHVLLDFEEVKGIIEKVYSC